ncbi:RNA polymerase sigma factor [bacterium]|nr:RNA polymerase sigma factor [bacterium]
MHTQTDTQLILAFKNGQRAAGEEITQRYYSKILFMCSKYLNSVPDGEDAAQEVFFKVIAEKKIISFRGQSKLSTWLIRVAINVCKSQFRNRSTKKLNLMDQEGMNLMEETVPCKRKSPEENFIKAEIQEKVQDAIEGLPRKCKKAMYSIYIRDYSYKEAAKELNIPVNILGVRLMYGRKLIFQFLRKEIRQDCSFGLLDIHPRIQMALN